LPARKLKLAATAGIKNILKSNKMTKTCNNLPHLLQCGTHQLGLEISQPTINKFVAYIELLNKWNTIHNLTAITDPEAIVIKHIFDSLSLTPFIKGPGILDFGTGAGLPGIPLSLVLPSYNFVLLDSSDKKTMFLRHVVLTLGLKNILVCTKRIEEFHFDHPFATIVTRATTKVGVVIEKAAHLCEKGGQILIMKGKVPEEELKNIKNSFELHRVLVPYLNEERHIVRVLV
jgi:16S rRNA (guanine527-N7)-methyltransferase